MNSDDGKWILWIAGIIIAIIFLFGLKLLNII